MDTTDQQAVTVAQIPEGMKPWAGGVSAPDDWNGGPVYLDWGHGEFEIYTDEPQYLTWKHDPVAGNNQANIIAYTPEPVPATNQAGEVERIKQYIADLLSVVQPFADAAERADQVNAERDPNGDTVYPWNYVNPSHFADAFAIYSERLDPDDWEAFNRTEQPVAALATQPATSQEGEREALRKIRDSGSYRTEGDAHAECVEIATVALAATPTPPTLSEDLREAAQAVVDDYPVAAGMYPSLEGTDGKPGYGSIRRLAAALAQVKAS